MNPPPPPVVPAVTTRQPESGAVSNTFPLWLVVANTQMFESSSLIAMFQQAIQGQSLPKYLSTDNDPLYQFHQWQANLRVLEVLEIKTVPYVPLSHPFVERLVGTLRRECLDRTLFGRRQTWRRSRETFRAPGARGFRRTVARFCQTYVTHKLCLVPLAEALSRLIPDANCRVIL